MKVALHVVFGVVVIVELIGRWVDRIALEYPVKPLIMIWVAVYFLRYARQKEFRPWVLTAFFFSWLGDIFLMLQAVGGELLFFAGVGAFLVAQVAYIATFVRFPKGRAGDGFVRRQRWWGLPFLVYLVFIYAFLYGHLDAVMKPVVLVYAVSLVGMSLAALNRKGKVRGASFVPVFVGSVLFVVSDSLIAVDKFVAPLPMAGFMIMLSYIAAQYLIMRGLIAEA